MNEKLSSLIQMLSPKAKRMTKDSIIESLNNLEISDDAKVDFEATKKAVSVLVEKKTANCIEAITYSLKTSK